MKTNFGLLIDGKLVAGAASFDVINPATEEVVASCPKADEAQLDAAVAAARAAFPAWSARSFEERGALLGRLADQVQARMDEFTHLLTAEQGKPLPQAQYELMATVGSLRAFGAMRIADKVLREGNGQTVLERRTPLGVCAAITPWNFPLILLINKLGPGLVTGNCMVVKPAPTTPLTTLLLGELCAEVLPPGVVNVICDQNELGPKLTSHPGVDKVSFTGSTPTGKKVMASAAGDVKRVTLELGGNDAAIVLEDMPPALAAQKVYQGAMNNAGQVCIAIKRAYVHQSIYEEFCQEIVKIAQQAVVDEGTKQGATIGPVQNKAQFEKVKALLESARSEGTVLIGGEPLDRPGYFIPPTIVKDLGDDAPLVREEQFGPVLPVLKFDDVADVIRRANDSEYGLGGSVWSRDMERGMAVARQVEAGTIWVNQHLVLEPGIPFRGTKQSGLGVELGEAGLHEYTQAHVINAVELAGA